MSWNAKRFQKPKRWNLHHVPPRHPALSTPEKIPVNKKAHIAYHRIFRNAGSLEQCIEILRRDWWPQGVYHGA